MAISSKKRKRALVQQFCIRASRTTSYWIRYHLKWALSHSRILAFGISYEMLNSRFVNYCSSHEPAHGLIIKLYEINSIIRIEKSPPFLYSFNPPFANIHQFTSIYFALALFLFHFIANKLSTHLTAIGQIPCVQIFASFTLSPVFGAWTM
jgi:hypothetical protein